MNNSQTYIHILIMHSLYKNLLRSQGNWMVSIGESTKYFDNLLMQAIIGAGRALSQAETACYH